MRYTHSPPPPQSDCNVLTLLLLLRKVILMRYNVTGMCQEERANKCLLAPVEGLECSNSDIVHNLRDKDNTVQQFTRIAPSASYENLVSYCRTGELL